MRMLCAKTAAPQDEPREAEPEGDTARKAGRTKKWGLAWRVLGKSNGRDDYLQQLVRCARCPTT